MMNRLTRILFTFGAIALLGACGDAPSDPEIELRMGNAWPASAVKLCLARAHGWLADMLLERLAKFFREACKDGDPEHSREAALAERDEICKVISTEELLRAIREESQ